MKRLIMTTLILGTVVMSSKAQNISIHYSRYVNEGNINNAELRALQKFEDQIGQFSYSMMVNNAWLARKAKKAIVRSMEKGINRTLKEIEEYSWNGNSYSKRNNERKYRTRSGGVYSKRNGYTSDFELELLFNQLRKQERIKYDFESTNLISSRRRTIVNKKYHRKLMYQYRDLMRDKLDKPRRNRRG